MRFRISRKALSEVLDMAGLVALDAAAWSWCTTAGLVVLGGALLVAGVVIER
ncbi:hypothetical protein [Kitasatospora sp. GP82]|uniref:hypothetical protein n=1 Tax=Kitasatospora sp. GP82 TaxID=3035089 RepID=UPI0024764CA8|nr:hypothetical protein [Kitasatospora sp. GP82]MDH6123434.1 hypothetical protein [Kitasatospora sp. GP82]